jgi:hypothetical protein
MILQFATLKVGAREFSNDFLRFPQYFPNKDRAMMVFSISFVPS